MLKQYKKTPARKRADSFEYWKDKMNGPGWKNSRQEAAPVEAAPIPPKAFFASDRCLFIKYDAPESILPSVEIKFSLKTFEGQKDTKLSPEWQASSKVTSNTGFLDLPKEIRDMIYKEVCGHLKRKGLRWEATAPRTRQPGEDLESQVESNMSPEPLEDDSGAEGSTGPTVIFADCAIMRSCCQVHAEFASILYASPLQLSSVSTGYNIIPLSPTYTSLVQEVLYAGSCLYQGNGITAWRNQLQIATGLSKVFPRANTIRLAFYTSSCKGDPAVLTRKLPDVWAQTVAEIQGTVKAIRKLSNTPLAIPYNLEVVHLNLTHRERGRLWPDHYDEVESRLTPVTEAIAGIRAKKSRRVKGGKNV